MGQWWVYIEGFVATFCCFWFFFLQMFVWPHHSTDCPCECPLCSSSYFEGTHYHEDSALVLSNGVELIGRCWKCELGVPFTCGHNSCLPRQNRVSWGLPADLFLDLIKIFKIVY